MINWSVAEDLIYSYNKSKKYNLIVSKELRVKFINTNKRIKLISEFKKGYYHSKIIKNFVYHNKELSILNYFYTSLATSFVGIVYSIFSFKFNNIFRYLGRLIGTLVKTYNYKIK